MVGVEVDSRIDQTVEIVEALLEGKETLEGAEIPLAEDTGGVAFLSEICRENHFAGVHAADPLEGDLIFGGFVFVAVVRGLVADHVVDAVALGVAAG